jgi:hypothetical protein
VIRASLTKVRGVAVRSLTVEHLFDGEEEEFLELIMKSAVTGDAAELEL